MKNRRFTLAAALFFVASAGAVAINNPEHDEHAKPQPAKPAVLPAKPAAAPKQPHTAAPVSPAAKARPKPPTPAAPAQQPLGEHGDDHDSASDAHPSAPSAKGSPLGSSDHAPSPDEAMTLLRDGNMRWVNDAAKNPNIEISRRRTLAAEGQHPFVTILTCADSRLPVERIFDRGVGDIFVTRVAGNIVGEHEAGTVEYGLEHLHTPLLVVMGHSKCGAVKAALAGGRAGGNIDSLLEEIAPAVDRAKAQNPGATEEDVLAAAVKENVWQSVFDLIKTSATTRTMLKEGKVKIVGAVCDISTGKVEFLGEHPWQEQLVDAMTPNQVGAGHGGH